MDGGELREEGEEEELKDEGGLREEIEEDGLKDGEGLKEEGEEDWLKDEKEKREEEWGIADGFLEDLFKTSVFESVEESLFEFLHGNSQNLLGENNFGGEFGWFEDEFEW